MAAVAARKPLVPLITFAEDLQGLARRLSDAMAAYRTAAKSRLAPVNVLVPHRAMGEWLNGELAALNGSVLNVRWVSSPSVLVAQMGREPAAWLGTVHRLLGSDLVDRAEFAQVRDFLEREGQTRDERWELRRYVLSSRIARALQQSAAHWPEGQAQLLNGPQDGRWMGLLWKEAASSLKGPPREEASAPRPLFVFDVAVPGQDLLEAVSGWNGPVQVFLRSAVEAPPGHVWHRHGQLREVGVSRWLGSGARVEAGAPKVERRSTPDVVRLDVANPRRGAESAAAQIWSWVRENKEAEPLRFHEVGVVVPTSLRDTLLPVLREVFDEAHELNRVLWRVPLGEHNRVVALCKQLLELPSTPLRRGEVLGVLTHPVIRKAFEEDLPGSWSGWLDAVGIFHGLDASSHKGTYLEDEAGNGQVAAADWDQGLIRLGLGAFVGADRSGKVEPLKGPRGLLVPEEVTQSSTPALGQFIRLVRSLLNDAQGLRSASLPAAEWRALLAAYLVTYVRPSLAKDHKARSAALRALDVFDAPGMEGALPWSVARAMALEALEGIHGDQSGHLSQGVLVGTPADLQGLSFRRLVVFGMEQGGFPARSFQDELDRRPDDAEHRPDDARRADSFHFHELVEATRGEVCLIATARDPLTGDKREPSLLARNLEAHCEAGKRTARVEDLPLHRRGKGAGDSRAFTWAFPEADVEREIRQKVDGLTQDNRPAPSLEDLPDRWKATLGVIPLPPLPALADELIEVSVSRLVRFLEYPTRGYAEQRLGYRGERDERDELIDEPFENDNMTAASLRQEVLYDLLQRHTLEELKAGAALGDLLQASYERCVKLRIAGGQLPQAFFFEFQRMCDVAWFQEHLESLAKEPHFRPPYARLKWGQGGVFGEHEVAGREPVVLEPVLFGVKRKVRVTGLGDLLSQDGTALFRFKSSIRSRQDNWDRALARQARIAPWLDHLLLQAGGQRADRQLFGQGKRDHIQGEFEDMSPDEARQILERIVVGLLEHRTTYCCPSLALLQSWDDLRSDQPWERKRELLEDLIEHIYKPRGVDNESHSPLRRVGELRLPDEGEFEEVCGRLAPLVRACENAELAQRIPALVSELQKAVASALTNGAEAIRLSDNLSASTGPMKFAGVAESQATEALETSKAVQSIALRLGKADLQALAKQLLKQAQSARKAADDAREAAERHAQLRAAKQAATADGPTPAPKPAPKSRKKVTP